jgi:hypothetical protein
LIRLVDASIDVRLTPSAERAATLDELLRPELDSRTTVTVDVEEENGIP